MKRWIRWILEYSSALELQQLSNLIVYKNYRGDGIYLSYVGYWEEQTRGRRCLNQLLMSGMKKHFYSFWRGRSWVTEKTGTCLILSSSYSVQWRTLALGLFSQCFLSGWNSAQCLKNEWVAAEYCIPSRVCQTSGNLRSFHWFSACFPNYSWIHWDQER